MIEQVRDEIADFLRAMTQENQEAELDEGIKRTVTLDLNQSCDDAESNIKVRVQRPRSNLKVDLDAASSALMERNRSNSRMRMNRSYCSNDSRRCWDKHHATCLKDQNLISKEEAHARMI